MSRKIDPKSVESLRIMGGILVWLGALVGGFLLWLQPLVLPINGILVSITAAICEMGVLGGLSLLLLRDRNHKLTIPGILAFSGIGFLFSSLAGLLSLPGNVVLYLIPVLWVSAGATWPKALMVSVISVLPETFVWLNIRYIWIRPVPSLPGGADPFLFDWNRFFVNYYGTLWVIPLLALMMPRLKSTRVVAGFAKSAGAAGNAFAKKDASVQIGRRKDDVQDISSLPVIVPIANPEAVLKQNSRQNSDLQGILESIVFFMSKNFKAHSALGLLSFDDGHTFLINAKVSKSNNLKDNVLVHPDSGMVGKAIREPNGFMTGSLNTYPDKVEYYTKIDEVNSLLVSRVVDEDSQRVMGLLVVDSPSIRAFEDADKELLNRFSKVAAKLISNARMRKMIEMDSKQNEAVYAISKLLANENHTRGVIGVLIENLRKVFDADRLVVCDFVAEAGQGRILRIAGDSGDLTEQLLFQIDDPFCLYGMAFLNKIEYLETEFSRENRYRFVKEEKTELMPAEVMVAPLVDDKGNTVAVIGLETNTSGTFQKRSIVLLKTIMANASSALTRAQMYTRLERQAIMDGLTKIPNHRHFQDTLDKTLVKCAQAKKPFALLLMDIDHFKKFNDTYGHPVGDRVLQIVAATVAKTIRPNDFVARYGGEEFTVILDTDPAQLFQAAERIREAIEQQAIEHEGQMLKVTVSIGASIFPIDAQEKKSLIELADQAMYHSKKNGRNRVTLWSQVSRV